MQQAALQACGRKTKYARAQRGRRRGEPSLSTLTELTREAALSPISTIPCQ